MHSVLLIVDLPPLDTHGAREIRGYFADEVAQALRRYKGIETLGEGAWLIQLDRGAQAFAVLVSHAEGRQLRHRAIFFQEPPAWVSSSPSTGAQK